MSGTKRHAKQCGFDVDGQRCDRDAVNQGLCHAHSEQLRRNPHQGMRALHAAQVRTCEFPGCDRRHNAHGLCSGHLQQLRRRDSDSRRLTPLRVHRSLNYEETNGTDGLRQCVFPNCPKVVQARGLCPGHYQQWRKTGRHFRGDTPDVACLKPLRVPIDKCSFKGCSKDHEARGLCKGHVAQARDGHRLVGLRRPATECGFTDCDRDPHARGLCRTHYQQLLRGRPLAPIGELLYPPGLTDEELLAWVLSDDASTVNDQGCRIWNGCQDRLRYGRIPRWGRDQLLHRFVFIVHHGLDRAIFGDSVHHACHDRACVRPDHLEAATARENTLEMHERLSLQKNIALRDVRISELEAELQRLRDTGGQP